MYGQVELGTSLLVKVNAIFDAKCCAPVDLHFVQKGVEIDICIDFNEVNKHIM